MVSALAGMVEWTDTRDFEEAEMTMENTERNRAGMHR
jgi:hypothetical protein